MKTGIQRFHARVLLRRPVMMSIALIAEILTIGGEMAELMVGPECARASGRDVDSYPHMRIIRLSPGLFTGAKRCRGGAQCPPD
jgi:hypothetical protein